MMGLNEISSKISSGLSVGSSEGVCCGTLSTRITKSPIESSLSNLLSHYALQNQLICY